METEIRYNRFKDAEWFGESQTILIGGMGGTGSHLAFLLSRTGDHELYIYDDDTFEEHNMSGQFVNSSQIGLTKVNAVRDSIYSFSGSGVSVLSYKEKYTKDTMTNSIVFSCFDNMQARKDMYYNWKEQCIKSIDPSLWVYVDLRLLAESGTIFFVQGHKDDFERYEANLFDDSEVPEAECTLKQTTHAASLIASMTVGTFTNWIANRKLNIDYRTVPFRQDFLIGAAMYTHE